MSVVTRTVNQTLHTGPACILGETMTILDFGTTAAIRPGIAMIQLHDELWRVTRDSGEVLGYVERFADRGTWRFRAKRMLVSQRRFVAVGEFWRIGDAVDCFA
ncbi:hypothetical protein BH11ACT2_BH11ACT2_20010 [soil metagenome]